MQFHVLETKPVNVHEWLQKKNKKQNHPDTWTKKVILPLNINS